MIFYILILLTETLTLFLFMKRQKQREIEGISQNESVIRKIKNIFTTVAMFLIPIGYGLCLKVRTETGEFVTGKVVDILALLMSYWAVATAGRVFERIRHKGVLVKVFYWLFEITAILTFIALIKAIII